MLSSQRQNASVNILHGDIPQDIGSRIVFISRLGPIDGHAKHLMNKHEIMHMSKPILTSFRHGDGTYSSQAGCKSGPVSGLAGIFLVLSQAVPQGRRFGVQGEHFGFPGA